MVRIFTDSTCDLPMQRREELGIVVVPLTIHFTDKTYTEGVDLTSVEFFNQLKETKEIPKTAQPSPALFADAFRKSLDAGEDIVGMFISPKLSGTMQSAMIAREEFEQKDRIHLIDSENVTVGLGLLVEIAVAMAQEGKTAEEITEKIEELKKKLRVYVAVDTLEYLKKGGRISSTAAVFGTMLNIHPLLKVEEGVVSAIGKARGKKALTEGLRDLAAQDDIDYSYPMIFAHGDAEDTCAKCMACCGEMTAKASQVMEGEIGAVVGTHTGPGTMVLAYIRK